MEPRKAKRSESDYPEQILAKRPKIEPELSPKIEGNLHVGDERKVMEKVEEDLDDNAFYERKLNPMELRSGKKLPPIIPGYKFRTQKLAKQKFTPCKHREGMLEDESEPDFDKWDKFGYTIIEKRLHLKCRCASEKGINSIRYYDLVDKDTGLVLGAKPKRQKRRRKYVSQPEKWFDPPGWKSIVRRR